VPTAEPRPYVQPYEAKPEERTEQAQMVDRVPSFTEEELMTSAVSRPVARFFALQLCCCRKQSIIQHLWPRWRCCESC